jgi:DNA (cytosine-5)-methyltransferase 1
LLRLQTFPKNWRVCGTRSAQVRQVGNATPPLLAEIIGRSIASSVLGRLYRQSLKLRIPRRRIVPSARKPAPLDAKYHKHVGRHRNHPGAGKGPGARARILREVSRSDGPTGLRQPARRIPKRGQLATRAA